MPVLVPRSSRPVLRRGRRRAQVSAFVASALGGVAVAALAMPSAVPSAGAAPDPCAASEVAKTIATVATNTGSYLDSHPQTNQALTAISQQPAGPQTLTSLKSYFDANPQAGKDLQTIQQPLTSMSTRCKLPISLPQALGLMQAAQQGGIPGAALPAATAPIASSAVSALP
jgi:hemophore